MAEEAEVVFVLAAEKSDAAVRETGASVGENWHPTAPSSENEQSGCCCCCRLSMC